MFETPGSKPAAEKTTPSKCAAPALPAVKSEGIMGAPKFDASRRSAFLGDVPCPDAKHGSFRLAAMEKRSIITEMARSNPMVNPNQCGLNSKDYSLQLNVRVPPGQGLMEFGIIWYPQLESGQEVSSITLVASGKGSPKVKSIPMGWEGRHEEWISIKPTVSLSELQDVTLIEIYATVEGNSKSTNVGSDRMAGCVGPPWAPAQVQNQSDQGAERNRTDVCLASMKAASEPPMSDSRADFVAMTLAIAGR